MMTKLKNKGARALTLFLTVLMALQLSAVTTFATPADECDHEYTYDLQFDFYELNYTTEYICLTCYYATADIHDLADHYLYDCEGSNYTSGKILTSITHYTAYVYGVEGIEESMETEYALIPTSSDYVESFADYYGWDDVVDEDYIGVILRTGTKIGEEMAVKFDSISAETTEVTAEPVTGQFYSSNGKTGLSATWVLWDGETELTDTEAATLTDTKTMYYYSKGSNTYYPFSGYETPETGVTILTKTCTKCGRVAVSDGCVHDYDDGVVTKAATCTADGSMTYTCADCGFSYTTSIEATGHTAGSAVKENVVAATCTKAGSYDSVVYCETCGEEISRETVAVAATGHTASSAVTENSVAATCTKDGSYDTVVYCKTCGAEISRTTTTVSKTGHTAGSAVTENSVAATCTKAGSYDSVVYCETCGDELSRVTTTVPATGHSYTSKVTKAATCTEDGVLTYTCSNCGDTYTESIEATGHTAGSAVKENSVAATCTKAGSYDSVVYCTVCGDEISRKTVTVKATGHTAGTAVKENVVEATATTAGSYDSVVYCTVCGEEISRETVTVPATGSGTHTHSWTSSVTKAATCTTEGVRTYTCSGCGESYTETIAATGHSYTSEVTKEATCTEDGVLTYTCSACGDTYTETIQATGHTPGYEYTEHYFAATYAYDGHYDLVVYCSVCGEEVSRETVVIPATGGGEHKHYYYSIEITVEPTCTTDGVRTYTCTCGDSYTDVIEATGHSYTSEVTKAATCTKDGVLTYTCSACGDTYTETIPATGHTAGTAVKENVVEATATTAGSYDSVVYCTVCGEEISRTTVTVPATGSDSDKDDKDDGGDTSARFLFDDVQDTGLYYYSAVYWAYDLGITAGTTPTTFSPSAGCTRAQFVTFLYKLAQATGVDTTITNTSCAFTDVDADDYFYNAVLWAAENGVTAGTSTTTFTPNRTITRAEAVAMLYRYAGSPTVSNASNPFTDVSSNDYYYNAVMWAVKAGVTAGTSATTFSPNTTCTRAMMVTFLHSYAG